MGIEKDTRDRIASLQQDLEILESRGDYVRQTPLYRRIKDQIRRMRVGEI